jgi:hypothetical protein
MSVGKHNWLSCCAAAAAGPREKEETQEEILSTAMGGSYRRGLLTPIKDWINAKRLYHADNEIIH